MTVLLLSLVMLQTSASTLNESLWESARAGDIARIAAVIDQGAADTTSSAAIAWSHSTDGTYIPIVYRDRLITLNVNGVVTMYDARTGSSSSPRNPVSR